MPPRQPEDPRAESTRPARHANIPSRIAHDIGVDVKTMSRVLDGAHRDAAPWLVRAVEQWQQQHRR